MVKPAVTVRGRRRNARGEGARLAGEIVAGAQAIIERTGSDEAVTLRSVAREIGIAAPSIYAHFADRDAIVWAVVHQGFDELRRRLEAATASVSDPVERLLAGGRTYVGYGLEHPALYRVLFARQFPSPGRPGGTVGVPSGLLDDRFPEMGGEAFALLVDSIDRCVAAGRSKSTDTFADATAVWVALHGLVSLFSTVCDFPWPPVDELVRNLMVPLARIDPAPAPPAPRRSGAGAAHRAS